MRSIALEFRFLALCILSTVLVLSAQAPVTFDDPYPFRAAEPSASPRIAKLRNDIRDRGDAAVAEFWNEMQKNGAPLIEPLAGDPRHSLITFVWRGSAAAQNVV